MRGSRHLGFVVLAYGFAALLAGSSFADEKRFGSFREVLELAGVGPEVLTQLSDGPDYEDADWQTLFRVLKRLEQFRDFRVSSADPWQIDGESRLGEIFDVEGHVVSVKKISLSEEVTKLHPHQAVYGCRLRVATEEGKRKRDVRILSTRIPKAWETQATFDEPVGVCGVLVSVSSDDQGLVFLSDHLAWYPTTGAPAGQILLARHGMDVALLDEVVHRRAFVRPEISREGEAFYDALVAFGKADPREVFRLAAENVSCVADAWVAREPELRREHERLSEKLVGETDEAKRELLQKKIRSVKRRRGIAAAVVDRGSEELSSVAPLFLQPEQEVGQLVIFEGVARRAVRIAAPERSDPFAERPEIEAYYEIEVFTADSQNLPITFCVTELPAEFPTGDEIRESVRIAGVFFKSWRYRSRSLANAEGGESAHQRVMTTPVVLGKTVVWLERASSTGSSRWAFWGGVAAVGVMALLWIAMVRLARRDRLARAAMRRGETIRLDFDSHEEHKKDEG